MDIKTISKVVIALTAEVLQSSEDLETMAEFAIDNGNGYFMQMCLAQHEESLKTIINNQDVIDFCKIEAEKESANATGGVPFR